jgi:hypothetical protein
LRCWYNAVTLATSGDGGANYAEAPAPRNLVATIPSPYRPGAGPQGMFEPSNIVRSPRDGMYYAMVRMIRRGDRTASVCPIRTARPWDAESWRGWDGRGFTVRFVDPYRVSAAPACSPVSQQEIGGMSESLTYNTVLRRFLLVGATGARPPDGGPVVWGFYYSTSPDLVHWTARRLLLRTVLPWTFRCGAPDPALYPSLIDPASRSRDFDTTGGHAFLYYTRIRATRCSDDGSDRDLVRRAVTIR